MLRIAKIAKRFLQTPSKISFSDLQKLLSVVGFQKIYTKGSHVKFKHDELGIDIVIPVHNNDCKDFYKKDIAKRIKHLIKKIT